jgi:hypothetical protein
MADVFIRYVEEDGDLARRLAQRAEAPRRDEVDLRGGRHCGPLVSDASFDAPSKCSVFVLMPPATRSSLMNRRHGLYRRDRSGTDRAPHSYDDQDDHSASFSRICERLEVPTVALSHESVHTLVEQPVMVSAGVSPTESHPAASPLQQAACLFRARRLMTVTHPRAGPTCAGDWCRFSTVGPWRHVPPVLLSRRRSQRS